MCTQALYIFIASYLPLATSRQVEHTKPESKLTIHIENLIYKKETLEESLTAHYQKATHALIQEFNYQERGNVLKYLPSVSYNFIKLAPSISYNSNKLANSINRQHAKKAKIKSIKQRMQIALQEKLNKLHRYYANLEAEINLYNYTVKLYQLKKDLFNLKKEEYKNLEITPTEFIQSQIKIKTEKLKLNKKYTSILKLRNHLLEIARANHEKEP